MVLSYAWLMEYLPVEIPHGKLSSILNAIGLEVEAYELYEEVPGSLAGLCVGRVLELGPHPQADRLRVARVDVGAGSPLEIVCGAPNVAAGQTVLVAPVGSTIHPAGQPPLTLRAATIRGVRSEGMLCAEDEVGLGDDHGGILVLPDVLRPGMPAAEHFRPHTDHVISIGLTPNRSDAMSHLGVARDVCAWLNHHEGLRVSPRSPLDDAPALTDGQAPMPVSIEAPDACGRYTGVRLSGVSVGESPAWLRQRLRSIGLRPVNNIVDVTNFVLHETGQPLHAFDADRIPGGAIRVMRLPDGTPFVGLDGRERALHADDLMICDARGNPLCMGGVFGGRDSGVTADTREVFLESAWFHPAGIRKTSYRHGLRTDAAMHFEKGVDAGRTLQVLQHAARLICEVSGGRPASKACDVHPAPAKPRVISFTHRRLRGLSGKDYPADTVRGILQALGFAILGEDADGMTVEVPSHKTDISLPADIAEEIMRIDGFDNIAIPPRIIFSPAGETLQSREALREKVSTTLAGAGFREMLNNSITASALHHPEELQQAVRMMNSLSADLDILRPSLLETGLLSVARNLNHRNNDLRLFEFGKVYQTLADGGFAEHERLALFTTGAIAPPSWNRPTRQADIFHLKGTLQALLAGIGLPDLQFRTGGDDDRLDLRLTATIGDQPVATLGRVAAPASARFDIRQEVFHAEIDWEACLPLAENMHIRHHDIPRFPTVTRDLAIVVDAALPFEAIRKATDALQLDKLHDYALFDVFESERLGKDRKSLAISFSFRDNNATLTDKAVEDMMRALAAAYEGSCGAQVRN